MAIKVRWEGDEFELMGIASSSVHEDAVYLCSKEGDKFVGYKVESDKEIPIFEVDTMMMARARVEAHYREHAKLSIVPPISD